MLRHDGVERIMYVARDELGDNENEMIEGGWELYGGFEHGNDLNRDTPAESDSKISGEAIGIIIKKPVLRQESKIPDMIKYINSIKYI